MREIFFYFTAFWIIFEMLTFMNAERLALTKQLLKTDYKILPNMVKGEYGDEFRSAGCLITIWNLLSLTYTLWGILGLFTTQWMWFIPLHVLGFIPKNHKIIIAVDAILCAVYLLALLVDTFTYNII